jgi:hypothetical protein
MNAAAMSPDPRNPVIANVDTERAVAADGQRILLELVDMVICDLFSVGLTLHGAMPHARGPAERLLAAAIDDVDSIISTIHDVVLDLSRTLPEAACRLGESDVDRPRRLPEPPGD